MSFAVCNCRGALATVGILILLAAPAMGQNPRGSILGTVTDSSGAVIPRVEVRATNTATGVAAPAVANEVGRFEIPYLTPGIYTVTAELSGFKKYRRDGIEVRGSEAVEVPIRMEIGATTETLEVVAQTPLLDTTGASLGRVVDQRRIQSLSVRGGNPIELELLTPGVFNATNLRLRKPSSPDALSSVSANGNVEPLAVGSSRQWGNEYQIDGIFDGAADGGRGFARVAFSPPAGAVQEFKILTTPYDASLGHSIGAVMSVTTAGGTNDLHGEAHFWLRNSAFDAANFFNNKAGTKPGKYRDDRYGFTVGGPVLIPRVFNGKNRTFWLFSWERNSPWCDPRSWSLTVPTEAERRGDFSALLKAGSIYQVYDPFTTTPAPNGRFQRQPFPNNVIPANRLDKVGSNLANLYGLPNQPGTIDGQLNFFNGGDLDQNNYHVSLARFDHAFSDNHRVFFRMHSDWYQIRKWTYFSNDPSRMNSDGLYQNRINKGLALDDVWVASPTLVLNVRYGFTNTRFPQWRISKGFDLASLGFSPALTSLVDPKLATIPRLTFNAFATISEFEAPGDGTNTSYSHTLAVNFTKTRGKHSLRFGVDARLDRAFENRYPYDISPLLSYSNSYTRGPLDNSPTPPLGLDFASMLLGVPAGSMTRSASAAVQDVFTGFYFQDDFKVSPKLTLNLGVRYELETPITERYDRLQAGFDFTAANPIQAAAQANYARSPIPELPASAFKVSGGMLWVGPGDTGRSPFHMQKNLWLPRFGFAYSLNSKTTVRAGYGIFYDSLGVYAFKPLQTGFSSTTPIQASLDSGLTYVATNANPFPTGLQRPLGPAGGLATNLNQAISFFNPDMKRPYSQKWSLGVQRTLPMQFMLEASYVGNRATRLGITRTFNNTPAEYLSTKPYRDQAIIDFLSQSFTNPFRGTDPIFGANISRGSLLRPYPEFGQISCVDPVGYSWYHSLQISAEKRFANSFTYQLGYTFSKLMQAVEWLNPTDSQPYRTIAAMDYPHRLTMSGVWEIPVGRGRKFAAGLPGPANFIAGGWQLAGMVIHQAGPPLGFGDVIFNGTIDGIALSSGQRNVDRWFNIDAGFNRNSSQQYSNHLRTFPFRFSGVRGPGQDSWDLNLMKQFTILERLTLQFRAEAYNALNHANLSMPNMSPTSSTFGRITGTDGDARTWQFSLKLTF